MDVKFFKSSNEFQEWLEDNHNKLTEIWVGYYKKNSGKTGITWQESIDQALCYGWIDSTVRRVDELRYANRFTPRRPGSIWSQVNINRFDELQRLGLLKPSGLKAFTQREDERSGIYSYENKTRDLSSGYEKMFKARKAAWRFFQAQPPSYQKVAQFWVMTPKQEATRVRRLSKLIEASAKRLMLDRPTKYSQRKRRHK